MKDREREKNRQREKKRERKKDRESERKIKRGNEFKRSKPIEYRLCLADFLVAALNCVHFG